MSSTDPQRISLDRLLFLGNVPAGMDWAVIGLWVCRLRKGGDPVDPPITVDPIGGTDLFRVVDGRHRVIAATSLAATPSNTSWQMKTRRCPPMLRDRLRDWLGITNLDHRTRRHTERLNEQRTLLDQLLHGGEERHNPSTPPTRT